MAQRRGPPRHASTAGKPHARSSAHWSPLPLTAPLLARADTQHATTTAVGATGPATIRSSRPQRPATTRSRQETSVQPRNHGPGLRITRGYRELQRSRSYCVAAVSDIWLGCLAPRKSGRGEMAASHQAVRAVSASSRMRSMYSIALMPSREIVSLHPPVRGMSAEVRYAGRPMSLRHQCLMARSTTWAWVPTVNSSRLSTSHPSSGSDRQPSCDGPLHQHRIHKLCRRQHRVRPGASHGAGDSLTAARRSDITVSVRQREDNMKLCGNSRDDRMGVRGDGYYIDGLAPSALPEPLWFLLWISAAAR